MKPPPIEKRRRTLLPPKSNTPDPPKPAFFSELPTSGANEEASRWRMIAKAAEELDYCSTEILNVVAAALADMPEVDPEPLLQRLDRMGDEQKWLLAVIVHALANRCANK